jgi:hypothetical protein
MPAAWQAWADLTHCVRTGETGLKKAIGTENGFEYLAKNPDQAEVFDSAMTDYTRMCAPAIAAAYDFSRFKRLVDIAGGRGLLISTILRRYTGQLRGVLFDLPHVTEGAKLAVAAAGVADRCEVVAGDFFQGVPEGADGYMLKHIIHDWPEEQAVAILRNIKKAMAPAGRLLLLENVIPEGNEPSYGKWLDLQMMALPGGKERNAAEYAELLGKAGFRLTSITPTDAQISIVEAMPVVG